MEKEYGPNFITLTDDEGNDIELEMIDAFEYQGVTWNVFYPTDEADAEEEDSEEDTGLIFLKEIMEDGETILSTPDSDEEYNAVYDYYEELLMEDDGSNE